MEEYFYTIGNLNPRYYQPVGDLSHAYGDVDEFQGQDIMISREMFIPRYITLDSTYGSEVGIENHDYCPEQQLSPITPLMDFESPAHQSDNLHNTPESYVSWDIDSVYNFNQNPDFQLFPENDVPYTPKYLLGDFHRSQSEDRYIFDYHENNTLGADYIFRLQHFHLGWPHNLHLRGSQLQ